MGSATFWEFIEQKMKCIVPMYLRNLLACEGFECIATIKNIVDDDITHFEIFAKSDEYQRKIPKHADLEQFYGSFYDAKDHFEILRGHKVLLREIAKYVSRESTEKDFAVFEKRQIVKISDQRNERGTPEDVQPKANISNGSLNTEEDEMESTILTSSKKSKKTQCESNKRSRLEANAGTNTGKGHSVGDTKRIGKPENQRLPELLTNNDEHPAKAKESPASKKGRGRPKLLSNNDEPAQPRKSSAFGKGGKIPKLLSNDDELTKPKKSLASNNGRPLLKLSSTYDKLAKTKKYTASVQGRGRPKLLSNNDKPTKPKKSTASGNGRERPKLLSNDDELARPPVTVEDLDTQESLSNATGHDELNIPDGSITVRDGSETDEFETVSFKKELTNNSYLLYKKITILGVFEF